MINNNRLAEVAVRQCDSVTRTNLLPDWHTSTRTSMFLAPLAGLLASQRDSLTAVATRRRTICEQSGGEEYQSQYVGTIIYII